MIQSYGPRVVCKPEGAYNPAKTYVPLDMVRYHDQSFIARTKVPSNQPPTDGDDNEYWAFWGAYSQEVSDLSDKIDGLDAYVSQSLKKIEIRFVKNSYDLSHINGNCFILKSETGKVYMFDLSYDFNLTNIVNSLVDLDVSHVDVLIISHYHADHANTPNLTSLHNMGYIDERTIAYTPRVPAGSVWSGTLPTIYADFMAELNAIGCSILVPDSNTVIDDENVHITFFNCDASDYAYYDGSGTAGYNDYSVCNYIEYNNLTIMNTGDIQSTAKAHIATLGVLKYCQIITSPHHGSSGYVEEFDKVVNPDYAVVMCGADYLFARSLSRADVDYYAAIDCKLLPTNNYAVELNANALFYSVYNGDLKYHPAALTNYDIYVDGNYTNEQDGTQSKPFTDIFKSLALARSYRNGVVRIFFTNYTVDSELDIINLERKIQFNNLTFNKPVRFDNSILEFVNCTFAGENGIRLDQSYAYFDGCTFDSGQLEGYGVWARNSRIVTANTNTFNNKVDAIRCTHSSTFNIATISGTGNTNAFNLQDGNSAIYVGTNNISATNIFNTASHTNVSGALSDNIDLASSYNTTVSNGTLKARIKNGMVQLMGHPTQMTLTGQNTVIGKITNPQLLPAENVFVPICATDTGYGNGTYYLGLLEILTNGNLQLFANDYTLIKQMHFTAVYESSL